MDETLEQAFRYILTQYGAKGYGYWVELVGKDAIVHPHPSNPDVEIEVDATWDRVKAGGPIRVFVSIYDKLPRRFKVAVPTASFIVFDDGSIRSFEPNRS